MRPSRLVLTVVGLVGLALCLVVAYQAKAVTPLVSVAVPCLFLGLVGWTELSVKYQDVNIKLPDEHGFDVLEAVGRIAQKRGVTSTQVAPNWVRSRPGVSSVLFGARTLEQLENNLAAGGWMLAEDELLLLNQVSERPLPYPYWHQRRPGASRLRNPDLSGPGQ